MFLPKEMVKISDFCQSEFVVAMLVMAKEMMLIVMVVMVIVIGIILIEILGVAERFERLDVRNFLCDFAPRYQ